MAFPGHIPEATIGRLPLYLRGLDELSATGADTVSSEELADLVGVNAAKVRKDLSHLGTYGTRGVGYETDYLHFEISSALGVANTWPVVVCGLGNLGRALINYQGFTERGFPILAAIDTDPKKIGTVIDGVPVFPPSELGRIVDEKGIAIGVIATPGDAAQGVVDRLVEAGIRSVMTLAPGVLVVPDEVEIRVVDLATELQILGYHLHQTRPTTDRIDGQ